MVKISHIKNVLDAMKIGQSQVYEHDYVGIGRAFDEHRLADQGDAQIDLETFIVSHVHALRNPQSE
ncbi:hypothetical protein JCM19037_79 [Geomicrobium sp. JCM 19037]|uniref:hypothetical protein n=1 Tax=unclassified Geomicrobium TaxID=2628951 RepID=UPI00045F3663|nr:MULTISPECIES: hypothetical protein [unclassified Geomicrobium]GAK01887.1 hypothetical protein JCM19037_79 [Geomicrobium sp. JCM 19037]GAK11090.1 hypothetical protein JCM19039_763 [Geomicrobium sp. JCM 19039]